MKILPIQNYSPISFQASNSAKPTQEKPLQKDNSKLILALCGLATIGIAGAVLSRKNVSKTAKTHANTIISELNPYPKDLEYRKELLKSINLPSLEPQAIRSIIGGEEYKKILIDFANSPIHYTPGKSLITTKQDEYTLEGVTNRTFRISLHNHTTHSDGKLSVAELLDQAANYADKVAETLKTTKNAKSPNNPFTIAITDHDTVEGCKEVIQIISSNPEKYKNLRVILGSELTVENRMLANDLKKPVQIHMVTNCINPFDKNLNEYLDSFKVERKKIAESFFNECVNEISKKNKTLAETLSFEEAKTQYPTIKEGLNYPWYFVRNYITQKANPEEKKELLELIFNLQKKHTPQMSLKPHSIDMEEAMSVINKQDYGYMTIAHPALTDIGSCLKNPEKSLDKITELFKLFKDKGDSRALATEIYYPYFGELGESTEWLKHIEKSAKQNNLLPSGGLDSHGKSIFYSGK